MYKIYVEKHRSLVEVLNNGELKTTVTFLGNNHKEDAMTFVAKFLMVQMGQIGY